jgi:1-phosphatidylinositol-3-phosphate 5-kinase
MVVKGVVCKKNMAHRRMPSKIEKPRFLILGGALEYQRVSNLLSSFDTLLQQVVFLHFSVYLGCKLKL